jgi:hypothetical protein
MRGGFISSKVEDTTAGHFDVDGDGKANTLATILAQWQTFRPYMFLKLREVVGPDGILIANSGIPHAPDTSCVRMPPPCTSMGGCHDHPRLRARRGVSI